MTRVLRTGSLRLSSFSVEDGEGGMRRALRLYGIGLFGALRSVRPDRLLLHLPRRVDVDSAPAAGLLAQTAARAAALEHTRHAEEVADALAADIELQRVEGTDRDADLTAGADAVVFDDDGLGPVAAREGAAHVAQVVQNSFGRAHDAAGAAVDAE